MENFNDKLPKTEKQWLHFALKVQAKINKIYKEYAKDVSIKYWFKKVKNAQPKYYSVAEKAAMELMCEFGKAPIVSDLTEQGYRYREDIEVDPE